MRRALFAGDLGNSTVALGAGVTVAVAIVLGVVGTRTFQRENA